MKKLILVLFCMLLGQIITKGQSGSTCNNRTFEEFITKGDTFMKEGNYGLAYEYYKAAVEYCPEGDHIVNSRIISLFSDSNPNRITLKIIDQFDFHEDRFAIGYGHRTEEDQNSFFFFDRRGREVDKLGRWDQVAQFDEIGFARVKRKDVNYLLDTTGAVFRVAFSPETLDSNTIAIDTRSLGLEAFLQSIFENPQLQIILIKRESIRHIPRSFNKLQSLKLLAIYKSDDITEQKTRISTSTNQVYPNTLNSTDFIRLIDGFKNSRNAFSLSTTYDKSRCQLKDHTLIIIPSPNEIPDEIRRFKNLVSIDFRESALLEVPKSICDLPNLELLGLAKNELAEIPNCITQISSLKELDLSENYLIKVPEDFSESCQLRKLNLYRNFIRKLPLTIAKCDSLRVLDLRSSFFLEADAVEDHRSNSPEINILYSKDFYYSGITRTTFRQKRFQLTYQLQEAAVSSFPYNTSLWFSLSFYALFAEDPARAIYAAEKVLELAPEKVSVETNLALGYLFTNQWKEAKDIYSKWKGRRFPDSNSLCNQLFLQDIADLEAAGVTHPDFAKVKVLLEE